MFKKVKNKNGWRALNLFKGDGNTSPDLVKLLK
jgi:hypothetical protein